MDRTEHADILAGRAIRHPELNLDAKRELANYVDASPIAEKLFGNFIHEVQKMQIH